MKRYSSGKHGGQLSTGTGRRENHTVIVLWAFARTAFLDVILLQILAKPFVNAAAGGVQDGWDRVHAAGMNWPVDAACFVPSVPPL